MVGASITGIALSSDGKEKQLNALSMSLIQRDQNALEMRDALLVKMG